MTRASLLCLTIALLACGKDLAPPHARGAAPSTECPDLPTTVACDSRRTALADLVAKVTRNSGSTPSVALTGSAVLVTFKAGATGQLFNGDRAGLCSPGLFDVDDGLVRQLLAGKIGELRCTSDRCAATYTLRPRTRVAPSEAGGWTPWSPEDELPVTTHGEACATKGEVLRALEQPE